MKIKFLILFCFFFFFFFCDSAFAGQRCFPLSQDFNNSDPPPAKTLPTQLCMQDDGKTPSPGTGYTLRYTYSVYESGSESCSLKPTAESYVTCNPSSPYSYGPTNRSGSIQLPANFTVSNTFSSNRTYTPDPWSSYEGLLPPRGYGEFTESYLLINGSTQGFPANATHHRFWENWQVATHTYQYVNIEYQFQLQTNNPEPEPEPTLTPPPPPPPPDECSAFLCQCMEGLRIAVWYLQQSIERLINQPAPTPTPTPTPTLTPTPTPTPEVPVVPVPYERQNVISCSLNTLANKFPLDIVAFNLPGDSGTFCPRLNLFGTYTAEACFLADIFRVAEIPALIWLVIQVLINL